MSRQKERKESKEGVVVLANINAAGMWEKTFAN